MTLNPLLPTHASDFRPTTQRRPLAEGEVETPPERWPIWVRISVIVGLSIALWSGIIFGILTLFR